MFNELSLPSQETGHETEPRPLGSVSAPAKLLRFLPEHSRSLTVAARSRGRSPDSAKMTRY